MYRNLSSRRMVCGFWGQVVTARCWSFDGMNLKPHLMLTGTLRLSIQALNLHKRNLRLNSLKRPAQNHITWQKKITSQVIWWMSLCYASSPHCLTSSPAPVLPPFTFQPFCWTSRHKGVERKWNSQIYVILLFSRCFSEQFEEKDSTMKMSLRDFMPSLFLISCHKKF